MRFAGLLAPVVVVVVVATLGFAPRAGACVACVLHKPFSISEIEAVIALLPARA